MGLDLRAALRSLRRTPAFTVGTILTLAIALGLTTTAVGLLAGALSGGASGNQVVLYLTERDNGRQMRMRWPHPAIEILRSGARSYERIASYTTSRLNAGSGEEAARLDLEFVSPEYFAVAGVRPAIGRLPAASDAGGEALISDRYWQAAFGAAPDVIGRVMHVSRTPITIVGVMPAGFRGLSEHADVWLPHVLAPRLSFADYLTSTEYFHTVIAQLREGVSLDDARSELEVIAARIAAVVPPRGERASDRGAELVTFGDARTNLATVRARTFVVIGAALVLLIAALNIAMLAGARVAARQREFAIRLAIGAGRGRVFNAVAMEVAIVTAAGLGAAMLVALWTRDLLAALIPAALATPSNDYGALATFSGFRVDGVVMLLMSGVAAITLLVIALPACRRINRADVTELLKRSVGGAGGRTPGVTWRTLLAVQIAASIALLATATLLFRSVTALSQVDPGFDPRGLVAFSIAEDLSAQRPDSGVALIDKLITQVQSAPGVQAVTVAQSAPFSPRGARLGLVIEGRPDMAARPPIVGWHRVGPDHFAALRIPIVRGRGFTSDDRRDRQPVVVINQAAARRYFGDADPIGQRIRLPDRFDGDPTTAEVVGVVGDVIYWPPDEPAGPDVYQPALQFSYHWTTLIVRADDPQRAIPAVREAVRRADPNLPLFDIVTLEELARSGWADRRFLMLLLTACAVLGLLLAATGVYAMTASWMEARRRELGVRVALGAQPRGLVALVMRGTAVQAAIGLAIGGLLALAGGRALSSVLFGVAPSDPVSLSASAAVMVVVAGAAAYVPARRALSVDPVRELNS